MAAPGYESLLDDGSDKDAEYGSEAWKTTKALDKNANMTMKHTVSEGIKGRMHTAAKNPREINMNYTGSQSCMAKVESEQQINRPNKADRQEQRGQKS
eukprot:15674159-Heterocapsa_arctica.AAC.1